MALARVRVSCVVEEPVDAGDADVEEALDTAARALGGERRLLGHRDVGGARRAHADVAHQGDADGVHDGKAHIVMDPYGDGSQQRRQDLRRGAGGEDVLVAVVDHALRDGHDLGGGLAGAEDRFGAAAPQEAVIVDPGEAEVVVREPLESRGCGLGVEAAGADLLQHPPQVLTIHGASPFGGLRAAAAA